MQVNSPNSDLVLMAVLLFRKGGKDVSIYSIVATYHLTVVRCLDLLLRKLETLRFRFLWKRKTFVRRCICCQNPIMDEIEMWWLKNALGFANA